jgi:hypothetical protein
MGWIKVAAGVVVLFVAWLVFSSIVGYIVWGVLGALVIGAAVLAFKAGRAGKNVAGRDRDREVRESEPRAQGVNIRRAAQAVDDDLARLKREMDS